MKWFFRAFMVLVVICGGAFYYLTSSNGYYSTKEYYVKMIANPTVESKRLNNGEMSKNNVYNVTGYDKEGKERKLRIVSNDVFEKNQYYIIHWEDRRGIISKKEKVDKTKIDKAILEKLNAVL
ncbi:YxeA family protein [Bacillus sp. TH13]|uniref:YxeA family protein n=1 Tax=Bacillus sp. TH13 TaxID=2796379 RepID=UPI00191373D6|nr:YxeA family protein [Bacillus sp. TH13]MBK5491797.1 YxeA family protein [Bacillus sp. TH13]